MTPERRRLFSQLRSIITNISFPITSQWPTFNILYTRKAIAHRTKELLTKKRRDPRFRQAAIGILPDDVLLDIFSFYVDQANKEDEWHTLVHVCQRWRKVVFGSPRRLHLTLIYDPRRPIGEMLGIWPAFPFIILHHENLSPFFISVADEIWRAQRIDNIIAALKHHERICQITVSHVSSWVLGRLAEGMCQPFPMLTSLQLSGVTQSETRLPDSFLGGSAPRLRTLALIGISLPALPNLLLSTTHLVHLDLWDLPNSAYIPPDEMVVCLSMLARLKTLYLGFRFHVLRGASHPPPPLSRSVLHALTTFWFTGNSNYLEDFISRIDVPLLNDIDITFYDLFAFDTPEFLRFINRTEMPNPFNRATVRFKSDRVEVTLSSECLQVNQQSVRLRVSWIKLDSQLLSLVRFCRLFLPLPLLSILEYLDIHDLGYIVRRFEENTQWPGLLRLFTSVKSLSLFDGLALPVMTVLGELVGERALEVLPVLQNVHLHWRGLSGPLQEPVGLFVAARKLSGHPVAIHHEEPGGLNEHARGGRPLESARRFLSH
ncbi:hypothetical protein BJV74DRAFT_168211 [Russula compacta]|nr:hypothetical protein BJV74DRAFT_168211 [Russula compacta]